MLYLILIIAPSIVGLILGFGLPKLIQTIWRYRNCEGIQNNKKGNERRILCIR